jgi:hypothetical protein
VEERNAGHTVDWAFMTHGIAWLRSRKGSKANAAISNVSASTTE